METTATKPLKASGLRAVIWPVGCGVPHSPTFSDPINGGTDSSGSLANTLPVPEPTSFLLAALGLLGLVAYTWRTRLAR